MGWRRLAAGAADEPVWSTGQGIDFSFEVGDKEKHRVHFSFDQVLGRLIIDVDGVAVVNEVRLFSLSTTQRYQFTVGTEERTTSSSTRSGSCCWPGSGPRCAASASTDAPPVRRAAPPGRAEEGRERGGQHTSIKREKQGGEAGRQGVG